MLRKYPVCQQCSDSNFPLCMAAHVENRKVRLSDLDHEPKGNCYTVQTAEQAQQQREKPNRDATPNPPNFHFIMLGEA